MQNAYNVFITELRTQMFNKYQLYYYYHIKKYKDAFMASKGLWLTTPENSRKGQPGELREKVNLSWCPLRSPIWIQELKEF